ncbi:MAG: response regulator [Deltaproteobacteria bacterium]|nr:MAG: response regulator [Deltaproteobacteria bacterium]
MTLSQGDQTGAWHRPGWGLGVTLVSLLIALIAAVAVLRVQEASRVELVRRQVELLERVDAPLDDWERRRRVAIRELVVMPEVRAAVLGILHRDVSELLECPEQQALRRVVGRELARRGDLGLFVIRPDGTSLASMHDDNVGTPNFLMERHPERMARAFAGETVFVPAVRSDVELRPRSGGVRPAGYPTAFFATPIVEEGEVVAVFTVRVDAAHEFAQLALGYFGETGEVVAFSEDGRLVSRSRFEDALRAEGLLGPDESSLVALSVKLPEGVLEALPGTGGGQSARPYVNYRGARVIGAWRWDETLGIGLLAEREVGEVVAVGGRTWLGLVVLLLVGLPLVFLTLRRFGGRPYAAPVLVAVVFIVLALVVFGATLRQIRSDARHDGEGRAHLLASKTQAAVDGWLQVRLEELALLGQESDVRRAVLALREASADGAADSQALVALSERVRAVSHAHDDPGFFVMTEDFTCLVSVGGGCDIQLEEARPALDGRTWFVGDQEEGRRSNALLLGPVEEDGEVIAMLALRLDTAGELSRYARLGRQALTGETYLVDAHGRRITPSRFSGDESGVGLPIHAPTGSPPRSVREVMLGRSGSTALAYVGERGVPLLGAWVWSDEYRYGVVSEIHVAEVEESVAAEIELSMWLNVAGAVIASLAGLLLLAAVRERQREEVAELVEARQLAEQANLAKDALLANVTHELRTPMNGVIGMIDLLMLGGPSPFQRDKLLVMRDSAESLLAVLNDLLDFSKLRGGYVTLEERAFPLRAMLENIVELQRPVAQDRGLVLIDDLDPDLPEFVRGDSLRLRQVITNLLSNALKFTERGRVRLSVRLGPTGMRFEVSDTGIGIAPDHIELVFKEFVQAEASTTRRFGGTGLGLPICVRILEAMDSELHVESVPDKGSTFWFTLELPEADAPLDEPSELDSSGEGLRTGVRILVAEDNAVNRRLARLVLEGAGHDVVLARDGVDAVDAVMADPSFDLVFMDVQMPRLDGIEAARRIRATFDAERLPMVALTALDRAEDIQRVEAVGMQATVGKPFAADALLAAVQRWARAQLDLPDELEPLLTPDPPSAEEPLVDFHKLESEWGGLGAIEEVPALLTEFLEELHGREPVLIDDDLEGVRRASHALKSTAATVYAMPLSRMMRKIEHAAGDGKLALVAELRGEAMPLIVNTRAEVRRYLENSAS